MAIVAPGEIMPICTVCGLRKKPIGRLAPIEMANSLCDYDCPGYPMPPIVSGVWPGEAEAEKEEF